jgi:hypothetical protein
LRAARGADLATVITVNDYTRTHDFRGAAIVLDHLGEPDQAFEVLSGPPLNGARTLDLALAGRLLSAA